MRYDTINPIRILDTVKRFVLGLGERGEVDGGTPPAGTPPAGGDWKASLPVEIKDDPIFEKYQNQNDVFKAFVGAQKFLGREKLPVPSGPEDKEAFDLIFKTIGRPDSSDKYELPTDFQIPKEIPFDDVILNDFKKAAHENGLSDKQFKSLYKWYMGNSINAFKQINTKNETEFKEAETSLRKEWGAAYKQNEQLANKVVASFAKDEKSQAWIEKHKNDPVAIKLFAEIGKVLSEDQLTGKPSGDILTPNAAKIELDKIMQDKNHPYWNGYSVGHKEAVERVSQLHKLMLAGK